MEGTSQMLMCSGHAMPRHDDATARSPRRTRKVRAGFASAGVWAVVVLAVFSAATVAVWKPATSNGAEFWLFAEAHRRMYQPIIANWNQNAAQAGHEPVKMELLSLPAMQRRMLGAFLGSLPAGDLMEIERKIAGMAFMGPIEGVGFVDLTDKLKSEGLFERFNPPSLSLWTSRGHVFGLPHDVHPVMLAYRADIFEAAGIDVAQIETWDDFERILRPLMSSKNDGHIDRYLMNMWENNADHLEAYILQAGGSFFDDAGRLTIASDVNAKVLARIAEWCAAPNHIAADAPNFSLSGNALKAEGYVLTSLMPDWMCDIWRHEIPQLEGKVKLMPLPAWERGGRRTSVWGGTMIGIPRSAATSPERFEQLWTIAKQLYLSRDLARVLWRQGSIVTPVREHWADPVFDEPQKYFAGQATGRMYIQQAPGVPARSSSPYNTVAMVRVKEALATLCAELRANPSLTDAQLRTRAGVLLKGTEDYVRDIIERNVYLAQPSAAEVGA